MKMDFTQNWSLPHKTSSKHVGMLAQNGCEQFLVIIDKYGQFVHPLDSSRWSHFVGQEPDHNDLKFGTESFQGVGQMVRVTSFQYDFINANRVHIISSGMLKNSERCLRPRYKRKQCFIICRGTPLTRGTYKKERQKRRVSKL